MISKSVLKEQMKSLPDKFTIDELINRLIFLEKVESGIEDSKNGKLIEEDELEIKIKEWFK